MQDYRRNKIKATVEALIEQGAGVQEVHLRAKQMISVSTGDTSKVKPEHFFPYGAGVCRAFVLGHGNGHDVDFLLSWFEIDKEKYEKFFYSLVEEMPNICKM